MQSTGMQGSVPGAAREQATAISEKAAAGMHQVSEAAQHAMHRVSEIASRAGSHIPSTDELRVMQERAVENARVYAREHPLLVIGIALLVGVILSRLTARR
jgi:ElaB/YqjD/DUF883 family membrane-anchored ribosome-binding protein